MIDLSGEMSIEVVDQTLDPRVSDYYLMSPVSFWATIFCFYLLIKQILPKYMENREPYKLNNLLIGYNAVQVVISAYLFYLGCQAWIMSGYSYWKCNSIDYSNSESGKKSLFVAYLYFLSKYTEFFDTIFFVLRKKYNQVSFLHFYHHISTPIFTWYVVRYYGGGTFMYMLNINTFVHVVMYTYYMLAAMGPQMQKYLWWKKYITTIQLIQFTLGIIHVTTAIYTRECNIPRTLLVIYLFNGAFLFALFSVFYKKQYKKKNIGKNISKSKNEDSTSRVMGDTQNSITTNNVKRRILL